MRFPIEEEGVYEETIYFVCGACDGARRFRRECAGAAQEWRAGHRAATSYVEPAGDRHTADWAYGRFGARPCPTGRLGARGRMRTLRFRLRMTFPSRATRCRRALMGCTPF